MSIPTSALELLERFELLGRDELTLLAALHLRVRSSLPPRSFDDLFRAQADLLEPFLQFSLTARLATHLARLDPPRDAVEHAGWKQASLAALEAASAALMGHLSSRDDPARAVLARSWEDLETLLGLHSADPDALDVLEVLLILLQEDVHAPVAELVEAACAAVAVSTAVRAPQ